MIINILSIFDNDYEITEDNAISIITFIILLLLFLECFEHNEKVHTPIIHSDNNFKNIEKEEKEKEDIGIAFEKILFGESIDINYLMENGSIEQLLDPNLYTGKDFENLRKIYNNLKKTGKNEIKNDEKKEEFKRISNTTEKKEKIFHIKRRKKRPEYKNSGLFTASDSILIYSVYSS